MTRVLVYGPESTRGRYVARLCAQILGWTGKYDGHGLVEWDGNCVVHRSLPYGERWQFERAVDLVSAFGIDRVVITCRAPSEAIPSAAKRHHDGDLEAARQSWDEALRYVREWIGPTFMFSSDACCVAGWEPVVRDLAAFLGRPVVWEELEPWRESA